MRKQRTIILQDSLNQEIQVDESVTVKNTGLLAEYCLQDLQAAEQAEIKYNTIVVPRGGEYEVRLPDRSYVWMNADSEIRFPVVFTGQTRQVSLKGEAYFKVEKDSLHPFIVNVYDKLKVEVLGTRFIVDNYRRKSGVEAVLVEGSVKIAGCKMNHSVVLTPGQLINYDKKSERTKVQMVNTDDYISWIQNELTFDNDKLADIIINLNKWYGVDIECPSEFAEKVFMSFSVRNGENLDEILKAMTLVAPIRYYWENGILHILPRK